MQTGRRWGETRSKGRKSRAGSRQGRSTHAVATGSRSSPDGTAGPALSARRKSTDAEGPSSALASPKSAASPRRPRGGGPAGRARVPREVAARTAADASRCATWGKGEALLSPHCQRTRSTGTPRAGRDWASRAGAASASRRSSRFGMACATAERGSKASALFRRLAGRRTRRARRSQQSAAKAGRPPRARSRVAARRSARRVLLLLRTPTSSSTRWAVASSARARRPPCPRRPPSLPTSACETTARAHRPPTQPRYRQWTMSESESSRRRGGSARRAKGTRRTRTTRRRRGVGRRTRGVPSSQAGVAPAAATAAAAAQGSCTVAAAPVRELSEAKRSDLKGGEGRGPALDEEVRGNAPRAGRRRRGAETGRKGARWRAVPQHHPLRAAGGPPWTPERPPSPS